MDKKKGFTLIELLAVIVLLAILVIIAVPNVIKMLNNTKQKTFMVEVENIIKGAKNAYATNTLNGIDKTCYSLSELSDYVDKDFTGYSGSVLIDASNNTSRVWLANDKYIVAGSYSGNIEVVPLTSPVTATTTCEEMYIVSNSEGEQVTTTMSTLIDRIDELEAEVENNNSLSNIFLKSHSVGSIYTTVATDETTVEEMHTKYGGTWAVYGSGKVLVGLDANDTDFDSITDIGGEKTHTLTTPELPVISGTIIGGSGGVYGIFREVTGVFALALNPGTAPTFGGSYPNGAGGYAIIKMSFGNNTPHNNMPPYTVVYMYQRTA